MDQKQQLTIALTVVIVGIVAYYAWNNCKVDCRKQLTEGYIRSPLSNIGELKRTPVTFAFRGDGMTNNPHYGADPSDKLVPLEFGGYNPYRRVVDRVLDPLRRSTTKPCHNASECKDSDAYIVNDSKARRDMIESGDVSWFNIFNNMMSPAHKTYPGVRPYDVAASEPNFDQPPLYSGDFHYNAILGQ